MLRFVCPHCAQELRVPEQHLGARGKCKKCGGRIALVGTAEPDRVQTASTVADVPEGRGTGKPATEKQLAFLRELGAAENDLRGLGNEGASALIERLQRARRAAEPATEKQMDYLRRLHAPESLMSRVDSKEAASALIEAMHLGPTQPQREALRALGATGAQIAGVKSRAAAEALLLTLREDPGCGD